MGIYWTTLYIINVTNMLAITGKALEIQVLLKKNVLLLYFNIHGEHKFFP